MGLKLRLFCLSLFVCTSTSSCAFFMQKQAAQAIHQNPQCYWMENQTGKFEWVATEIALSQAYTYQQCFEADSCDGGLGASGGGCYKWSNTANSPRLPWAKH